MKKIEIIYLELETSVVVLEGKDHKQFTQALLFLQQLKL